MRRIPDLLDVRRREVAARRQGSEIATLVPRATRLIERREHAVKGRDVAVEGRGGPVESPVAR
jgi:hypothetical protein